MWNNKLYHNDSDQEKVVCQHCEEFINESILDDREFFRLLGKTDLPCDDCGRSAN